jgi:hypothetical protein
MRIIVVSKRANKNIVDSMKFPNILFSPPSSRYTGQERVRIGAFPMLAAFVLAGGTLLLCASSGAAGAALQGDPIIALINCGSCDNYTDATGPQWESDKVRAYYEAGAGFGHSSPIVADVILNANADTLYQTHRLKEHIEQMPYLYEIPVPSTASDYVVTLSLCRAGSLEDCGVF